MTTRSAEPATTSPSQQRSSWPWMIAGAVVVIVAVVVTLVLVTGDTDGDNRATTTSTTAGTGPGYDLSTPEAAAKSFAAAAATGSGDTLLGLACVGRPACVREHAAELGGAQLTEAQDTIREGVYELGDHLKGADFTSAVDGDDPGTKNVPYRTPAMTGDAYLALTFIQSEGDWLFYSR
jgi:hypothetical protein